jgi:hypothetical protein
MKQTTQQTNGALAKNKKVRELSIKSYYSNPNFCAFCNKVIEIGENDIPSQIRLKKYCNHSCYSAHKVGRKYENRRTTAKEKICKNCNENFIVKKRSLYRFEQKLFCDNCRYISKSSLHKLTKADLFAKNKNWQSARSSLRKHASSIFKKTKKPLLCIVCGYKNHVEIAHVKSVSQFPDETLISKINECSNLVALCPNHHWEFDNGYFSILSNN